MIEKKYTNQDIWTMGAENTANLLNKLTKENQKLKDDKNQHLLDLLCCNPIISLPRAIGLPYDNIYHRTSKQLENHLKDNGFLVDTVSRSSVGELNDENYNKIYRFCGGEIVDGLNRTHYNPQKEDDMQCICTILNAQINQANELQKRNNRQAELLEKQQKQIDNYIDIKAKLKGKITEYETKSEEYELSACGCGSKHNWIKKTALEEFRDGIYGDKNNSQF